MIKPLSRSRATMALGFCLLVGLWQTAAGAEAVAKGGTLEKITVHGKSLEGNLSGDTADRVVYVYLPPSYATARNRHYPVVYFLHGFSVTAETYVPFLGLPASIDRAIGAGNLQDMIFVLPDAMNAYGGSMYSDSITTGDWEAFIARDLVGYIDAHYRSIRRREARGLAGHSMGGYGTLRIGMKYSDTFSALYSMSGCCLDPRGAGPADAALEKLTSAQDVAKIPVLGRTTRPHRPPGQPMRDAHLSSWICRRRRVSRRPMCWRAIPRTPRPSWSRSTPRS